jgi:predicted transcriptional regulator
MSKECDIINRYAMELRNKGYDEPDKIIMAMLERLANNPHYDLLHAEILKEMRKMQLSNNAAINKICQELGYYYGSNRELQEQIRVVSQAVDNYQRNNEITKLTKKIVRRATMLDYNYDAIQLRCGEYIEELKKLDPEFNLENLLNNLRTINNMSDRQRLVMKKIDILDGY